MTPAAKVLYPLDFGALAVLPHGQIVGFCGVFRTFGCFIKISKKFYIFCILHLTLPPGGVKCTAEYAEVTNGQTLGRVVARREEIIPARESDGCFVSPVLFFEAGMYYPGLQERRSEEE